MKRKLTLIVSLLLVFVTSGFSQSGSVLVCLGSSSYAYHKGYCQGLKKCRASVETISLKEAEKMGRTPCGYCYGKSAVNSSSSSSSPGYAGECRAITKKGTRCKRAARSNGYCWQHGG